VTDTYGAFMTSQSWTDDATRTATVQKSLLSRKEGFFSSNPHLVAGELIETPLHTLSVVLLELCDRSRSRWVLIEQDPGTTDSTRWKFPGGRITPGEMPLQVAVRSVTENICLLEEGLPVSWSGLQYSVLSVGVEWLTELCLASDESPDCENYLVFFYHARLQVSDVNQVELVDLKSARGRRVLLTGMLGIQNLISDAALCSASAQLWQGYWRSRTA
jgi:hypothetical protein